jgi:hypothetical protein
MFILPCVGTFNIYIHRSDVYYGAYIRMSKLFAVSSHILLNKQGS